MTHGCRLADRRRGTVTVAFSKRQSGKEGCGSTNQIFADENKITGSTRDCLQILFSCGQRELQLLVYLIPAFPFLFLLQLPKLIPVHLKLIMLPILVFIAKYRLKVNAAAISKHSKLAFYPFSAKAGTLCGV